MIVLHFPDIAANSQSPDLTKAADPRRLLTCGCGSAVVNDLLYAFFGRSADYVQCWEVGPVGRGDPVLHWGLAPGLDPSLGQIVARLLPLWYPSMFFRYSQGP